MPFLGVIVAIGLAYLPHQKRQDDPLVERQKPPTPSQPPEQYGFKPLERKTPGPAGKTRERKTAQPVDPRKTSGLPEAYAPWNETPPALRGVKGLVRDAQTKQPIAKAWIAWRLPPPALVDRILESAQFRDPRFKMISDAQGRFQVDRLPDDQPTSHALFAVARGYAYAVHREVGLQEEVVFDLQRSGTLIVDLEGPADPRPRLRLRTNIAHGQHLLDALPTWGGNPTQFTLTHLRPGSYAVHLDTILRARKLTINAGATTHLKLDRPELRRVTGTLRGVQQPTTITFRDGSGEQQGSVTTDRLGGFRLNINNMGYTVFVEDGKSVRRLPGFVELPEHGPLLLDMPPRGEQVRVRFTRGGKPLVSRGLGLVSLSNQVSDGNPHLGTLVHLAPTKTPGTYAAQAPKGRYGLFDGTSYFGPLQVPCDPGPRALETTTLTVTWTLPKTLRRGEIVRGELALVPRDLYSDDRAAAVRFAQGAQRLFRASHAHPRLELPLGVRGQYVLLGKTDLGALIRFVTIRNAKQPTLQVPLLD